MKNSDIATLAVLINMQFPLTGVMYIMFIYYFSGLFLKKIKEQP
tara:strand:+ start:165 stop:296 length:132 start_codon:yes stop_codon:yes gene_type:complete